MSDTAVSLRVAYGVLPQATVAGAARQLLATAPTIVWCEPTPARTRLQHFPGLWTGSLDGLGKHLEGETSLDEARFFWATGWAHLLQGRAGIRWAAFHEAGDDPAWLEPLLPTQKGERPAPWSGLRRERRPVLLVRDLKRYGLEELQGQLPDTLHVVEYHQGTDLVGWKLEH